MLNYQLNAGRGFHPRCCGSPDAIPPEQVLRPHRSAQGRHGGQAHVPSFIRTSIQKFHIHEKESTEQKNHKSPPDHPARPVCKAGSSWSEHFPCELFCVIQVFFVGMTAVN